VGRGDGIPLPGFTQLTAVCYSRILLSLDNLKASCKTVKNWTVWNDCCYFVFPIYFEDQYHKCGKFETVVEYCG